MIFTRIKRISKLGIVNTWRNRWLSVPAVFIIMMTLFMMGVFVVLGYIANTTSDTLKDKITVQVDFNDSATEDVIQNLQQKLSQQTGVIATYISKQDALADFKSRTDIKQETRDLITEENNPLPRGLRIRTLDLDNLSAVEEVVREKQFEPYIYKFSYEDNKLLIERVNEATKFIKKAAAVMTTIFVVVAIMVTLNTIQMAIYSRRDEIEIMRLVGASQSYVKVPFYIEGAIYGISAATLAFLLLVLSASYFNSVSASYFRGFNLDAYGILMSHFFQVLLLQLLAGALLGIFSSAISIRKYVRI